MSKPKQIQMPQSFVFDVLRLVIALDDGYELDVDTRNIVKSLEMQIQSKLESMERRKTFTEYKTAVPNSEIREEQRRKYVELAGIHKDWTSETETLL